MHKIWDGIAGFRCLDPLAEASFAIGAGWFKLQSIHKIKTLINKYKAKTMEAL